MLLQALYDGMLLMCFNMLFAAAPILVYGLSEQNFSDSQLVNYPQLYQLYKKNDLLRPKQFLLWICIGNVNTLKMIYAIFSANRMY